MTEIKEAHNKEITNFRYYLDKIKNRDLVLSISSENNELKIWNINNFECILHLKDVNENQYLNSACILNENNQNYIITSNCNWYKKSDPIKVFDFNGNKIKEINNSNDVTFFIDTHYDKNNYQIYILTATSLNVKSYDYKNNKIYKVYDDNYSDKDIDNEFHLNDNYHRSLIIYESENLVKLAESCVDGHIRIWDFHSGKLLNKILIQKDLDLIGLCLYKNKYLFIGREDENMKLIDLNKGFIITISTDYYRFNDNINIITIKTINHPKYGECLITQTRNIGKIKLWVIKNLFDKEKN